MWLRTGTPRNFSVYLLCFRSFSLWQPRTPLDPATNTTQAVAQDVLTLSTLFGKDDMTL